MNNNFGGGRGGMNSGLGAGSGMNNNFGGGGGGMNTARGGQQMQSNRNMGGQSFGNQQGNFAGAQGKQGAMRAGMLGGANFGDNNVMGGRNGDGFQQARSTGIGYGGGGGGRGDRGFMNQQGGGFQQQQQGQGQRNLFQNLGRLPGGSAQRQQQGRLDQGGQYQNGGFGGRAPQYPKSDAYSSSIPGSGLGYNSDPGYGAGRSYNKYRTLDQMDRYGSQQGPRATFSATDNANYGLPPCYSTESRYNKYRTLDQEMNRQASEVSSSIY